MNEQEAIRILDGITRRFAPTANLLSTAFDKQFGVMNDPARLKSISCTRRAAKSYTSGLYLFKEALEHPKVNCLYIGLTRDSAKRIMWKDVLTDINDNRRIGAKPNIADLSMTLQNGSVIYLLGADSDEKQKEKILGQKFKLIIVDEAASYTIDLRRLVYGILRPTTTDWRGTICLTGTAGNIVKGLFFDVVNGIEPGWSRHSWTTFDNPYMAKQWEEEIAELIAANPLIVETALFKQMYLNQWVVDEDKLVYKYKRSRNNNAYTQLPAYSTPYRTILGIDLGYDDETAFIVNHWHAEDPNLYISRVIKKAKLDITDVANIAKELDNQYKFDVKVVDGSDKQAVMELNNRHSLNLIPADKTGKSDFIEIFNAELIQGRIKVCEADCKSLTDEWEALIWDEKSIKRKEHESYSNHACDAALYAWRYTYTYLAKTPEIRAKVYTPQWFKDQEAKMEEKAELRYEREKQQKDYDVWQEEEFGDEWTAITAF